MATWALILFALDGLRRLIHGSDFSAASVKIHRIGTAADTARLDRAGAPGNMLVTPAQSGLVKESVINVSQLFTVDRSVLTERVGNLPAKLMKTLDEGLRLVLGL